MFGSRVNTLGKSDRFDPYGVGGVRTPMVAAFDDEYYRSNGSQTTFSNLITHARAGNATMTDSDGLIKWAPHNLLTYSEDLSDSSWLSFNIVSKNQEAISNPISGATAAKIIESASLNTHGIFKQYNSAPAGVYTQYAIVHAGERQHIASRLSTQNDSKNYTVVVDLSNGSVTDIEETGSPTQTSYSISDLGDGWYFIKVSSYHAGGFIYWTLGLSDSGTPIYVNTLPRYTGDGVSGLYVKAGGLYRSDLGGMVDNPDRGDSYVPTTSSAVYLPRRGHHVYNGYEWVNKGILVESEARTNVVTYSDQFNNAAWTKAAPTITADAIASPDGNDNADKLVESSTTAHAVYQVPTVTAVAYTFSVFAKSAERTQVNLDFTGGTNGAYFNLSTGEVISSSGTGLTAAITPMGNDWYRCSITQVQSAGAIYPSVSTSVGGARVYLGDGSSGIYIYGAQLEAGSTPSSYIPTNGSSVTRAAETVTVPYANLPYSSIAMSIAMMGEVLFADTNGYETVRAYRWRLDTQNYVDAVISTFDTSNGRLFIRQASNAVYDEVFIDAYQHGELNPYSICGRHGSTFINGAADGIAATENTTPTSLADLSAVDFQIGHTYMGTISSVRIWDRDIGDTGIAEATA